MAEGEQGQAPAPKAVESGRRAQRLVLVVVAKDRQHRPEDLLLRDRHVGRDVGEHGRRDVVAGREKQDVTTVGRVGEGGGG